jgi:hypothetical protein
MSDILNPNYEKRENESKFEYGLRLIEIKCEDNPQDLDWQQIVDFLQLGIHKDSLRKACNTTEFSSYNVMKYYTDKENEKKIVKQIENNEIEDIAKQNYKEQIELNKDGSQTSDKLIQMSQNDCKDVEFLLKSHGYDSKEFVLTNAKNSIWNSYNKVDGIISLFSSKITVKPRTEYYWNTEDIEKIFLDLKSTSKNTKKIEPKQYEKNGQILLVPIADLHFALLTDTYSNNNDYNMEIAEQVFMEVIEDVISRNKYNKFEKVVFVTGNDTTNSDNINSTTTAGTQQQDSAMWFTVVDRVTTLLIHGIDRLSTIAPVDIVYVPSNHDLHTMFGVVQTINAYYREDDDITVDTSPLPRKYYQFGTSVLAFSHDVKVKDALKIVSTEAKDMWSASKRVIFMLAHLHQAMEYDKQGMLEIRRLPTISGFSRWTNGRGYIQTERKNQAFILDYNKGIIDIQNTILDIR